MIVKGPLQSKDLGRGPREEEVCHVENRVEELRKRLGLSQEAFAKALRVSRQTVSSIETGKYNPSLELAFAISDFFERPIEEIFLHKRPERSDGYEEE